MKKAACALIAVCLLNLSFSLAWAAPPFQITSSLTDLPRCGSGEAGNSYFTISAVGDLLLHENIQAAGNRLGYAYLFEKVRPFFEAADGSYANFEGVITPGQEQGELPYFAYKPDLAVAVKEAGIDIVSTANNHALDRGTTGADSTIRYLDQIGLIHHGTVGRGETIPSYKLWEIKNGKGTTLKVGLISLTYGTNGVPDPYNQVNMLWDSYGNLRQSVKEAISIARKETELVIIAAHWGNEYETFSNAQQQLAAREMAELGVDILLGDHPHVVQPVDIISANGHNMLAIYSLGNFVAGQEGYRPYTQSTLIFYAGIIKDAAGKASVSGYRYLPVYIENNTRPVPISSNTYAAPRAQILTQMRDMAGERAVSPNDPSSAVVCPVYRFKETPDYELAGDFARYFQTLGTGNTAHPLSESVQLIGLPISKVQDELAGDCRRTVKVLYTERQRLEWQPEASFPYRVVGTQLGAELYLDNYQLPYPNSAAIPRRLDLTGNAIGKEEFRQYFRERGGVAFFGYPLSDILLEIDLHTGDPKLVQYFERARFELTQDQAGQKRVQLGLLSKEYGGIARQCSR